MEYIITKADEYSTREMLKRPITEIARLIGAKWFLPPERLSEKSGVALSVIRSAIRGEKIHICYERKLRKFLENYKGEMVCTKNLPKMP